jgi:hypothetical protein
MRTNALDEDYITLATNVDDAVVLDVITHQLASASVRARSAAGAKT